MRPFDFTNCLSTLKFGDEDKWEYYAKIIKDQSLIFLDKWKKELFSLEGFLVDLGIFPESIELILECFQEKNIRTQKEIAFLTNQDCRYMELKIGARVKLIKGIAICQFLDYKGLVEPTG